MITTSQFQERLIEYLDGELPEAERREVEEYLRAHPEAALLEGDLALLSEAGRSLRESSYPADLLLEANRALDARFAARSGGAASARGAAPVLSGNGSPQKPGPTPAPRSRRRWRPRALAAVLAAAAVLLAGAASQRAAIAEVAGSFAKRIWVSIDGEPVVDVTETIETAGDGFILLLKSEDAGKTWSSEQIDESDDFVRGLINMVPLDGEPRIRVSVDTVRVISGPVPAGKTGASPPDVPARSWGDVKESINPKVETSP